MSFRRSMYANQDEQEETGSGAAQHPKELIDQIVSGPMDAAAITVNFLTL